MKKQLFIILMSFSALCYAQEVNIPDPLFLQALIEDGVDTNGDGLIQVSEAEAVVELIVRFDQITDLEGIQAFVNLTILFCEGNKLVNIDLSNNTLLTYLDCSSNDLEFLNLSNNPLLQTLDCGFNYLTTLNVSNLTLLTFLDCSNNELQDLDIEINEELTVLDCSGNNLTEINVSDKEALLEFYCSANDLIAVDVTNNLGLEIFHCAGTNLASFDVTQNHNLKNFKCNGTDLESIDLSQNPLLESLYCISNDLESLDLSANPNLLFLQCYFNKLSTLDLSNNVLLEEIWFGANRFETVDFSNNSELLKIVGGNSNFTTIDVSNNLKLKGLTLSGDLTEIDVTNNLELDHLEIERNNLTELDVSNNLKLDFLEIDKNNISSIDLSANVLLEILTCSDNQLTILDLSNNPLLTRLISYENPLEFININNGGAIEILETYDNSELLTICLDEVEFDYVASVTDSSEVILSTDCSLGFPSETFKITGNIFYSEDTNCDSNTTSITDVHFSVNNGVESVYKPVYNQGVYLMKLVEGDYDISLNLDNQQLFNFAPEVLEVGLNSINSPYNQGFCFWPKDPQVVDAKITIIPIDHARPGFDVEYKIIFENQGNVVSYGSIQIDYAEDISQYISSSFPMTNDQGVLTHLYSNLLPFEKREFILTLRLNSPMDTPALTGGIIKMYGDIVPQEIEYYEPDNHFSLCQNVVNSFDPNDKTCLQGSVLLDEMIGSYVDYMIRFENTGTADAVNITIQDAIDLDKFDVATLRVTDASHPVYLQTENNIAKFIFDDINLPFQDESNDGYVTYKIKTLENLSVGDSLKNTANIFFDFNFPIQTNTTVTTVVTDMDGDGSNNLDDCDDSNANINPNQNETPYNGIDDDCDPATLDDDIDQDGFLLIDDCDDDNSNINPNQTEEPYNGIDDDCNTETLDNDIDQDGFLLVNDCNDQDAMINPEAIEIPNNDIDEDCDGEDLVTSTFDLVDASVKIYPNPVIDIINIEIVGALNYSASLYDLNGVLIVFSENEKIINVNAFPQGTYLLKIKDMVSNKEVVTKIVIVK